MTTIFAPITSINNAAVCTIRISGPATLKCLEKLGVKKNLAANKASLCEIYDLDNQLLDQALVTFFQAPRSYTGQDVAEISIHASTYIFQKIFRILSAIENVRLAEAGEFSKIAFLNNKIDLIQAEAIVDLIAAETESQHRQALKQLKGELGQTYENWRFKIIEILALIESSIDFPDEDLPQNIIEETKVQVAKLKQEILSHIYDNHRGQKIKEGLNLAIIGPANVGKSSLLNFLAKSEIAIVSDIAGTTRDIVTTHLNIAGIAVKIADTAGIRDSQDLIEIEGIKRAKKLAMDADIKILMFDHMSYINDSFKNLIDDKTLVIFNKIDLGGPKDITDNAIKISLKNNLNTDLLIKKLEEKVREIIPLESCAMITQERYRQALINAVQYLDDFSLEKNIELAAEDLRLCAYEIAKISGRVAVDDILDVVFTKFCIGK